MSAPVVLELFTSQGCSSCPPADALLGVLARLPHVIALAWHVDYWNGLGWQDPYASPQFTQRQRQYAAALGQEVFTPALVINGSVMEVGSDRAAVRMAMEQAPRPGIPILLQRTAGGLAVDLDAVPATASLLLAGYEAEISTQVGAGENAGRRLREFRVVRQAYAFKPKRQPGLARLPPLQAGQGAVLLVQDQAGRVVGAADLPA